MENNPDQKKWFIYVADHHEGPFTVAEIQVGIAEGKFSKDSFVWCQGQVDWQPMSQVPEFLAGSIATSQPARPAPVQPVAVDAPSRAEVAAPAVTLFAASAAEDRADEPVAAPQSNAVQAALAKLKLPRIPVKNPVARYALAFAAALVVVGLLLQTPPAAPVKERIFSLFSALPPIPQIDPADETLLKSVATASLDEGPQVGVALSREDVLSPVFFIATNLPSGTAFEVHLEGIPETLLNTLQFSRKIEVVTDKRLGRSDPIRYPDGKLVPRGNYRVYVMEKAGGQPEAAMKALAKAPPSRIKLPGYLPQDRKAVFMGVFFLGSRDATYPVRLKEYHEKVAQKAKDEIDQLRQVHTMLESQLSATVANFDRLQKQKPSKKATQAWRDFSSTWKRIDDELGRTLLSISPESLRGDYFYGILYQLAQAAERTISELHGHQAEWLATRAAAAKVPEQIDLERTVGERALVELKTQLDGIEKNPLDANGLPTLIQTGAP